MRAVTTGTSFVPNNQHDSLRKLASHPTETVGGMGVA